MQARRTLYRTNGSVIVKPLVVMAARLLGPGPLRLRMVKLAHDLSDGGVETGPDILLAARQQRHVAPLTLDRPAAQPTKRAA